MAGSVVQTPLERVVEDFASRPEVAPKTRRYYKQSLGYLFLPWAAENDITEPEQLTPEVVDRYAAALQERRRSDGQRLAEATRRAYLRALRQFLAWAVKRRGIKGIDPAAVVMPTLRRKQREVLSPREVQALEDAAAIERDKLIIRVMAETGAREGEIANLTTSDVIQRERRFHFLRLRGKTGERLTTISGGLHDRLIDYAKGKSGRPMRAGYAILFMGHRKRNRGDYEPLTEAGIYQVVRDAAERAALGRRVYPHLFRHTRITQLVNAGTNIATIADELGVSVEVIARNYMHQTPEQRHEAIRRALEG